jgi:hypothetical protein
METKVKRCRILPSRCTVLLFSNVCQEKGFVTAHAVLPQALSKSLFSNNDLHTEPVAAIQVAFA